MLAVGNISSLEQSFTSYRHNQDKLHNEGKKLNIISRNLVFDVTAMLLFV